MNESAIRELQKKLRYHNVLYYHYCDPELSDYEYDQMFRKLEKLEEANPESVTPDSPT